MKLVFASYIILQVALSILWILRSVPKSRLTIACNALTIFGYCTLLVLSYLEHTRSLRPSNVLCVYFVISIPLDLPRIRTLFFLPGSQTVARFFLASFVIKVLLFALEVSEKRRLLCLEWSDASPEATSSVISRALFLWLNTLLRRGFRTLLSVDTLTPLDSELLHASRPAELMKRWERSKLIPSLEQNIMAKIIRRR